MKATTEKVGSGFVLSGRRILTNAHVSYKKIFVGMRLTQQLKVVADHTYISVKRFGGTQKFPARVLAIAHDCDLV